MPPRKQQAEETAAEETTQAEENKGPQVRRVPMVKKITKATLGCEEGKADFSIACKAGSFEQDESQYGPFYRLFGIFEAVNNVTGEAKTSTQAILPSIAENLIVSNLKAMNEATRDVFRVALRLYQEECSRAESPNGIIWRMEVLTSQDAVDEMEDMRSILVAAAPEQARLTDQSKSA